MLFVFDFRFRQRRLIVDAPVHGTRAFVNETSLDEAREQPRCFRFVMIGHRDVRIVPFAENSQALKISRLTLERIRRKLTTGAPNTERRHVFLFLTKLPLDVQFDRQTMTVIAGNIRRIVAQAWCAT